MAEEEIKEDMKESEAYIVLSRNRLRKAIDFAVSKTCSLMTTFDCMAKYIEELPTLCR